MTNPIDKALIENKSKVESSSKKVKKELVDEYLNGIKAFESDRVELAKRSEKRAWTSFAAMATIAICAVIAVAALAPLKTVELRVVRVNDTDGSVSFLPPMGDANPISYGDVLDKYWSRQFIVARNGYNWETVQDNYNLVSLMANKVVLATYKKYIKAPNSPVTLFVDKKRMKITIKDVTFLPSTVKDRRLAQIRFTRDVINTDGETDVNYEPTSWNATITFDYLATIKTSEDRTLNPLGFRVTSYNEDRVL